MGVLPGISGLVARRPKLALMGATASYGSASGGTTYTATLAVGAAFANRIVVVGFSRYGSAGAYTEVKINNVVQDVITPSDSWSIGFVAALVPAGTTISWSCKTASSSTRHACAVWTADLGKPTFQFEIVAGESGLSGSIPTHRGECLFGVSRMANTATYTWTGLDEDYDFSPGSSASFSAASKIARGGDLPWEVVPSGGSPSAIITSLR